MHVGPFIGATLCGLLWFGYGQAAAAVNCTATIGELNFGTINVIPGAAIGGSAPVNVSCTFTGLDALGTTVRMCLNIGNGSGGRDAAGRYFEGTAPKLKYQLFTEGTYSTTWGDRAQSFPTVPTVNLSPSSPTASLTLYGRIAASQQTFAPGDYVSHFTTADVNFRYGLNVVSILSCDAISLALLTSTINPTFDVKTTIEKNCSLSTSDIDFGSHGVLGTALTDDAELSVRCTHGTPFEIGLDNGENGTAPDARRMKHLSQNRFVTYGLYKSSGTSSPWGNSGALRLSGTGSGLPQTVDVFGLVPAQSTPPPGVYRDHVVVTVTY